MNLIGEIENKMRKRDLLLISSAIGAGLISLNTKSNSPAISNMALFVSGVSAYLARPLRIHRRSRASDLISEAKKADSEAQGNAKSN